VKTYLVETSVIIDYLRGKQRAVELIDGLEGRLVSSFVCLAELYEGVYRVKNKTHVERAVRQFFASMGVVLGLDDRIAKDFGRLRARLKSQGKLIEDMDLLIAATCLSYDATLITFNEKHFARVPGLKLFDS